MINEMEGHVKGFKPKTYDVARQMKAIEAFEAQAVKSAQETKEKVDVQVKELEVTLRDIKEVRGFDDLTVVCFSLTHSCSFIYLARPVELLRDFSPFPASMMGRENRFADFACLFNRMMLQRLNPGSTSTLPNWYLAADGWYRVTTFVHS